MLHICHWIFASDITVL